MNHTIKQRKILHDGLIMIDQKYRYTRTIACDRRYFLALAIALFITAIV